MERDNDKFKKKKRVISRRRRTLDPSIVIDYKSPDNLKRFITDRGKIISRRISGATTTQQREIVNAVKRARYLGLLPFSNAHLNERGFSGEMTQATLLLARESFRKYNQSERDDSEDTASEIVSDDIDEKEEE